MCPYIRMTGAPVGEGRGEVWAVHCSLAGRCDESWHQGQVTHRTQPSLHSLALQNLFSDALPSTTCPLSHWWRDNITRLQLAPHKCKCAHSELNYLFPAGPNYHGKRYKQLPTFCCPTADSRKNDQISNYVRNNECKLFVVWDFEWGLIFHIKISNNMTRHQWKKICKTIPSVFIPTMF